MTFEDLESWQQARQLTLGLACVIEDNYTAGSQPCPPAPFRNLSGLRLTNPRRRLCGGGGETPGRCGTTSDGRHRWRTPRILLLYQP